MIVSHRNQFFFTKDMFFNLEIEIWNMIFS